ncbi:hypothetical protein MAR_013894 [Mya arenaria]|uniref:EF-hand domain-containing protein n=1 Tax=Mya arenaria TaxID=6604 RepID=A0ABY7G197_MYAAR|nr:hypothetical protein MAR_013894 [Mya arenaria]
MPEERSNTMLFKYTLILVICIILIDPSDAKKEKKKSKKKEKRKTKTKEKRSVTDVEPPKLGCKAQFSVVCPVDMTAADVAIAGGTARTGTVVAAFAAAGVAVRKNACKVEEKNTCKLLLPPVFKAGNRWSGRVPFSDDISDYDVNGDKRVNYEEFVFAVTRTVNLAEPTELRRPFTFADVNGDGELDTQEFIAAPFLFAHVEHSKSTNTMSTIIRE